MRKAEIEFRETVKIKNDIEALAFNMKAVKVADTDQYQIKCVLKAINRNRSKSFTAIDKLVFDKDFKIVMTEWLDKLEIVSKLKEQLKIKLENDFEYLDLMR